MLQPDLKRLRGEVRRVLSSPANGDWSPLDWFAFAAALIVTVGVHFQIRKEFPFTGFGEHMLALGLGYIATATAVYALVLLPLMVIRFLKGFWWAVTLAFVLLIIILNRHHLT